VADIHIRLPNSEDAARLAAEMRPADRAEVEAASGPDVERALDQAIRLSTHCWAAERDGELLALFGFAPVSLIGGIGSPWFLGTPAVDPLPGALTRMARRYVQSIRETAYPVLVNYVDARNRRSVRWLKRLGFTVFAPEPYGVAGLPFHRFEMRS
jgi:RimJ/RimL family protein N-acetyltransferase